MVGGLLGTAGPAFYGWTIRGDGGKGWRLGGVSEGVGRVGLGDGEDVLEVVCEGVRLVRTLAESLGGVADAGDKLVERETRRGRCERVFFGGEGGGRTGRTGKDVLPGAEPRFRGCSPSDRAAEGGVTGK